MAAIIAAVYAIIMVESMTAGIALYFAIKKGMESIIMVATEDRTLPDALTFAFYIVAFAGFLFSLPCLCYAVHKRHGDWVYPYLVFRLLLLILVIAVAIYLVVEESNAQRLTQDFCLRLLIPVGVELLLGGVFFWLAFLALRHFARYRIDTLDRLLAA